MKQRRSIRSIILTGLLLCIILTLLSTGAIAYFSFRYATLRNQGREYSIMISHLNQMLLDLNNLEYIRIASHQYESPELTENYSRHRTQFTESVLRLARLTERLGYDIDVSRLQEIPEVLDRELDFPEINRNVQDIQKQMREVYSREAKQINRIEFLIILGTSGFFFSVVGLIAFLSRSLYRYYGTTRKLIDHLGRLLRMENTSEVTLQPRWQEEDEIASCIADLENDLHVQRKLLNLPVVGTLEDFLPQIFPVLKEYMPCNRIGVAFLDSFRNIIAETAVIDYDRVLLNAGYRAPLSETTIPKLLKDGQPRIINDLEKYYLNAHQSEATLLLIKEGISSSISVPIHFEGKEVGVLFVSSTQKNSYSMKHARIAQWVVNILKVPIFYSYMLQEILSTSARSFADIVEKKDYETGSHLARVTMYAYTIASELSRLDPMITPKFVREIYWFAALHDIGKVGIPDSILLKPGKLDSEEFSRIQHHVTFGEEIMRKIIQSHEQTLGMRFFDTALEIISGHHEKWDGSGYPQGLKGEKIPLAGRIIALVDVFDALTSPRPYKPAYPFEESVEMIRAGSGTHFDPQLVKIFLQVLPEIRQIYLIYHSSSADTETVLSRS